MTNSISSVHNKKDSLLMKIIDIFLKVITFGKQNQFMISYVTTVGDKIYVPNGFMEQWSAQSIDCILFHENVHVEQYRKEGFLFYFKYLFFPIPCFHAHCRLEYELEAYSKDIVYSHKKYGTTLFGDRFNMVIEQMTGPMYFWTCTNRKNVASNLTKKIIKEMAEY